MRATVSSQIAIDLSSPCSTEVLRQLRSTLSFENPEYAKRERLGLYIGRTPRMVEGLKRGPGCLLIPRGAVDLLRQLCQDVDEPLELVDERIGFVPRPMPDATELRDYQHEAVIALVTGGQGLVIAPCGAGKTTIAVSAIARVGQPALILVHAHDLLEQWRARIRTALGLEAGVVSAGKIRLERLTVATVQTLVRLPDAELAALTCEFGVVVLDEAHHVPATMFWRLMAQMPARYRWGLSATPERDDGLTPLLGWAFGATLYSVGRASLLADGHLEAPTVEEVSTGFVFDWTGPEDWNRCLAALVDDPERNRLIVELVAREASAGHSVLVLSGRVEHCRSLAAMLSDRGVPAEVLVGKVSKRDRARILDAFRAGTCRVVIASTLADEGLDVPRLDRLVLATPSKAQGRTIQRVGRLMRPSSGKAAPKVIDIVDGKVGPLRWQAKHRRRAYAEALGAEVGR